MSAHLLHLLHRLRHARGRQRPRPLARFARSESGGLTVEFVLIVPFLISAYVMAYAYFDAFQTKNSSQKAAYAVSDLISRETVAVDAAYVQGMKRIYDYLAQSRAADSWLRMTSIVYDDEAQEYRVQWSYVTAELKQPLTTADLLTMQSRLPLMSDGETVLLTETGQQYTPVFDWMFTSANFAHFIPTSPRFAPQLAWRSE